MPDIFEIADCHIALGGDQLNTVPRFGVTAGEIAVLQVIHGSDAVHDIIPRGTIERTQRVERDRLKAQYGNARNSDGRSHVDIIYPGAAARIFERLDELELADAQFKSAPVARANPEVQAERAAAADAADEAAAASVANQPVPPKAPDEEDIDELEGDDKPGVLD